MKIMSFSEINDLENGQQIPAFQGTVKKVLDQRTGVGEFGPWTLQTLFLQDEHAHEVTVTWTCPDPFDAGVEGQTLYFESGRDKKEQLVGLKREIRKKNGKTYESVKVDDRAKVKILSGGVPAQGNPEIREPHRTPPSQPDWAEQRDPDWPDASPAKPMAKQEAPATAPELPLERPNGDAGVMEARKHLMKACNLYNLCIKAAVTSICPNIPDEQRTNDQFQSTLASLWIEASSRRSTNGVDWWSFIDKMPETPMKTDK